MHGSGRRREPIQKPRWIGGRCRCKLVPTYVRCNACMHLACSALLDGPSCMHRRSLQFWDTHPMIVASLSEPENDWSRPSRLGSDRCTGTLRPYLTYSSSAYFNKACRRTTSLSFRRPWIAYPYVRIHACMHACMQQSRRVRGRTYSSPIYYWLTRTNILSTWCVPFLNKFWIRIQTICTS
jgi:hypothetical protein